VAESHSAKTSSILGGSSSARDSVVVALTSTGDKALSGWTITVAPDTPAKRREYAEEMIQSFYIGNADPRALGVAVDALRAFELMGLPEGTLPLTQAVTYLALAPKSNAVLTAYAAARAAVTEGGPLPVPMHLRNAPTKMMKSLGYGAGYKYPHNFEGNYVPEDYLPSALKSRRFYTPTRNGFEREMAERYEEMQRYTQAIGGMTSAAQQRAFAGALAGVTFGATGAETGIVPSKTCGGCARKLKSGAKSRSIGTALASDRRENRNGHRPSIGGKL